MSMKSYFKLIGILVLIFKHRKVQVRLTYS